MRVSDQSRRAPTEPVAEPARRPRDPQVPAPGSSRTGGARVARASQRIVDQLRLGMRQGRLAPGDRLPAERQLCEHFGVSRVTVREALRVLEAGGLVDIRLGAHGGAFVTAPAAEQVTDGVEDYLALSGTASPEIHEARKILELGLIPLVCERARAEETDRLARRCEEQERARRRDGIDPTRALAFHFELARASGNSTIATMLRPLHERLSRSADANVAGGAGNGSHEPAAGRAASTLGAFENDERSLAEHRELVGALRDRDTATASAILDTHLERAARRVATGARSAGAC